jgi:tetratricopeptide (TPR) repeat protein
VFVVRAFLSVYVAIAACSGGSSAPAPSPSCRELNRAAQWVAALERCAAEYFVAPDPTTGLLAARAAAYLQKWETAKLRARALIPGPRAADAEALLGECALQQGELPAARGHLQWALAMHAKEGKHAEQARDGHQLAGVYFNEGEYQRGLDVLQVARAAAVRANDARMLVYLDIAAADLYRVVGDARAAEREIVRAVADARDPGDRALAHLKQGIFQTAAGQLGPARVTFERALAEERGLAVPRKLHLEGSLLNLAYIARKAGKPAEALARLEEARPDEMDELTRRMSRGVILAELGKLDEAIADLQAAEATNPMGEWSWWVPYQLALVETKAGHADRAIEACRRSVTKVTGLASRSGAYGPLVIANLRQPHVHLIGLLAARGEWSEVMRVVTTLDTYALLDSREAPADVLPTSDRAPLARPALARRPLGDASTVAEAWRGRRLVVVVPGGERIWRLVLQGGALEGKDLGEAARLDKLARVLETRPDDAEAGRILGEAMLGGLAPGAPIELLAVGQLARAPLAALRLGGRLALAQHRLARVPGVLPWKTAVAVAPPGTPRAVVLGDPTENLPASAEEVKRVAARLAVEPRLGKAATRAAFAAAAGAPLLHVSGHSTQDLDGPALQLADGRVTPADLARLGAAPRLVVLATCAAGRGRDEVGSGSIANAFLDAGAQHVVATRWTIDDRDAVPFVAAFYAARGAEDPLQGLAAAQLELAGKVQEQTRAAFEVLAGRPTLR